MIYEIVNVKHLHMHKYVRLVMIYEIVNVKHLHMHKYVRLVMIYEIVNKYVKMIYEMSINMLDL